MSIKPLADRVLILPAPAEEKTIGGIIIPDTAKEKPLKGEVVAVGHGTKDEEMVLKVGDTVLYGKPLSSVSKPLNAVYTAGILRNNTGVDISALVGTPRNEAGTPFYTGVKSVPRPVRLTAHITYLRQSNRYDLVVAVSDTVKHLRP